MKRASILLLTALVAACTDGGGAAESDGERIEAEADGFSCNPPRNWSVRRDRGAVLFTSEADPRRTIAIRSVSLGPTHSAAIVARDTGVVLRALPGADIQSQRELSGPMPGMEFRLTFEPHGTSARYARRHVLLAGRHHAFHVIETSPVRSADDEAVLELVASMREES